MSLNMENMIQNKKGHENPNPLNLEERLEIDLHNQKAKYDKQARLQRVTYKIKKIKILEKFSWEDSDFVYAY